MLDQGVTFKAYGQKICYVAPESFTERVMNAIADVYTIDCDPFEVAKAVLSDSSFWCLFEEDMDIMKETENTEMFGRWISISQVAFSRETLVNFVTRDRAYWRRVATNKRADCMFVVDQFGPWKYADPINAATNGSKPKLSLLFETVDGYPYHDIASQHWWRRKKDSDAAPVEPVEAEARYPSQPLEIKPSTLEPIINKPGRVLVKREGVRGNSGRFIVGILVIVGIVAMRFNWARRDNWLEIIFDAVQVMSLGAAAFVAVIYVWTKTLASTLDWLRVVTEVFEDEQLAKCLGVSAEEVKIATTYEHECFVPAVRQERVVLPWVAVWRFGVFETAISGHKEPACFGVVCGGEGQGVLDPARMGV